MPTGHQVLKKVFDVDLFLTVRIVRMGVKMRKFKVLCRILGLDIHIFPLEQQTYFSLFNFISCILILSQI